MFDLDRWEEIWQTISRNRKRSIMTAFGVFWGIFMLTVMMGSGLGLRNLLYANLNGMNENSCFLWGGKTSIPYKGLPAGRYWQLDNDDMRIIETQIPGIKAVGGIFWGSSYNFSRNDRKGTYSIVGYTPSFQQILPQRLLFGRFFNEIDMEQQRKVCVITERIWQELFPGGENPVGRTIRMNNTYLTVVGVTAVSNVGISFHSDASVLLPLGTVQRMYNTGKRLHQVSVAAYDGVPIPRVEESIKQIVNSRHTLSPDDTKAVMIWNMSEQVEMANSLFRGLKILTWIVGLGTLLAGIVGISNIMLVTVTERTSEFGIRKALGAKPVSIIRLILTESVMITAMFGYIGMVLGVAVMEAVNYVINQTPAQTGNFGGSIFLNPTLDLGVAVSATVVLVIAGLIAGYVPAYRAAQLKTIDALRYNK